MDDPSSEGLGTAAASTVHVCPNEASSLEVLVVDDDEATRTGITKAVRALGHSCRDAPDGERAWAMLRERPVDVVISDWHLSGMTGTELCRQTRAAQGDGPYTYFLLITGSHDRDRLLEGMAAGADDFQKKPIDLDELEAHLVSAARVVSLHRRLVAIRRELMRDRAAYFAASRTDVSTGLGNRLRMSEELAGAWSRARRYGHRYSLALCDVDRFKDFNDAVGHLAGDEALRKIAMTLTAHVRPGDSVYRYGGEEFVVLLPEQNLAEATSAVERLRAAVERLAIVAPVSVLTMSAGVAELNLGNDDGVDSWLRRAEDALSAAKAKGRNRVRASKAGAK